MKTNVNKSGNWINITVKEINKLEVTISLTRSQTKIFCEELRELVWGDELTPREEKLVDDAEHYGNTHCY